MPKLVWSSEIRFERDAIGRHVPFEPGLYKILQNKTYARYRGRTRVLKIGMSKGDLNTEILNHFNTHTAANRLHRIRGRPGISITVRFAAALVRTAKAEESRMLRRFEGTHWDLPFLNSQRGFARGEDSHYRRRPRARTKRAV